MKNIMKTAQNIGLSSLIALGSLNAADRVIINYPDGTSETPFEYTTTKGLENGLDIFIPRKAGLSASYKVNDPTGSKNTYPVKSGPLSSVIWQDKGTRVNNVVSSTLKERGNQTVFLNIKDDDAWKKYNAPVTSQTNDTNTTNVEKIKVVTLPTILDNNISKVDKNITVPSKAVSENADKYVLSMRSNSVENWPTVYNAETGNAQDTIGFNQNENWKKPVYDKWTKYNSSKENMAVSYLMGQLNANKRFAISGNIFEKYLAEQIQAGNSNDIINNSNLENIISDKTCLGSENGCSTLTIKELEMAAFANAMTNVVGDYLIDKAKNENTYDLGNLHNLTQTNTLSKALNTFKLGWIVPVNTINNRNTYNTNTSANPKISDAEDYVLNNCNKATTQINDDNSTTIITPSVKDVYNCAYNSGYSTVAALLDYNTTK